MKVSQETGSPQKQSASYVVFLDILRGLYEGRYVPGQRLVETDLVEDYGATRFVIKDAIKLLVAEGVAVNNFYRSCQIPRLSREEAQHIFQVMDTLFGLAAQQAAQTTRDPELEKVFRDTLVDLKAIDAEAEYFEFGRLSSRFFRTLAKLSGNTELLRILPSLRFHLIRAQFKSYPSAAEYKLLDTLEDVVGTTLSGNPKGAAAAITHHFGTMAREVDALPDRAFSNR